MELFRKLKKFSLEPELIVFKKPNFDINEIGKTSMPDPASSDYALLAIDYWRREQSINTLTMRNKGKIYILYKLFRMWIISIRIKQATIHAHAIEKRNQLILQKPEN